MPDGSHSAPSFFARPRAARGMGRRLCVAGSALMVVGVLAAGCKPRSATPTDQKSLSEYDLARDAFEKGKLREALDHVQKSLQADSDNADAAYLGAIVHLAFCNPDERATDCHFDDAERYARKALDANADHRDAKNMLGVVLIHEHKYDEAIAVLKPLANDILYVSPEKSWGNLGWAYLEKGAVNEAIDALRRAVAAQPLFCAGWFKLGIAYEKKGELAAARESLTKCVETPRPECARMQDAFDARARIALKQGLREEARADYEKCTSVGPTTPVGTRCGAALKGLQ
jgi:Tfp pilus assembly protein PilF